MTASLSRLFDPKSIAIVGASAAPEKPGFQMVRAFEDFPGRVYPVNPRGGNIAGLKVYSSLRDIPEPVDLIAMVVPPQASADVLREAAACGAGAAFMVSGGFSETGGDGHRRQAEILDICRRGGIRLLGPNTSGFMRPSRNLSCTFLPAAAEIKPGNIGIVAQSGGINLTAAFLANERGLGVSLSVGIGNGADVGVPEAIAYLADDPETDVIAVHLEGVARGRCLFETVRAAVMQKPVIVLPVGKADLGGFAESHTGNLMGAYDLTCAALRHAGAVVVDTTDALIDGAHALSKGRLRPLETPGVGILTGQAGPGLLITDKLIQAGIAIPEIGSKTVERIRELLPPLTYITNPVDTGRPLESFDLVCDALAGDPAIDAMLVYALHEEDSVDFVAAVGNAAQKHEKPMVFATQGRNKDIDPLMQQLEKRGVTTIRSPDRAAAAVRALAEDARGRWASQRAEALDTPLVVPKLPARLDEASAKDVLDKLGIATPSRVVCGSREAAAAAIDELKKPSVVKILDAGITHKTELGGVHVGVRTRRDLDRALDAIDAIPTGRRKKRYLIEELSPAGVELIIGARNDPSWGPVVLVGLGGTAAEAYGDVAMRLAPLTRAEALDMLRSLRAAGLLDGFRGAPAADRDAVAHLIVRLGEFVMRTPGLREVDLNPVRAYPEGVCVLDAVFLR